MLTAIGTALGWGGDNPNKLREYKFDPAKIARDTIAGNLSNMAGASELASQQNTFNTAEMLKAQEKTMPGYGVLRDEITKSLTSMARGEVSDTVNYQLQQEGAARGINMGTQGSERSKFADLQKYGLTSLEIQGKGLAGGAGWIAAAPKAPLVNMANMFTTTPEALQFQLQQAQLNMPIREFNNWVDTLPSNLERGGMQMFGELDSFLSKGISSALGRMAAPSPSDDTGDGGWGEDNEPSGGGGGGGGL